MAWKYDRFAHTASNDDLSATFKVRGSCPDDVEIDPVRLPEGGLSDEQLLAIKEEIRGAVRDELVRWEMDGILRTYFPSDYATAASVLTRATGKNVSVRSLQAWLIDPGKPSSRRCPEWALKVLKQHVAENALERAQPKLTRLWSGEVRDSKVVEFATDRILREEARREKWRKTGLDALPDKLFELELRVDEYLAHLSNGLTALKTAVRGAEDFEAMKSAFLAAMDEAGTVDFLVRQTRADIEQRKGEFGSDDGVEG
ncbi:protein of unknown function [Magnetospirillum gryphiswaldense MSR-1 v2]|uniref:Uncharacterized protein n=1 Tax=Magnetospirillum gryphiswaldense (strain DSM 6361 / JCM 21280 / NBRC 15271 / MSR-1) TaxID=431944 RepID=V6F274_MAGGM|nr:hypothetical protein [Magnetospirillum gryphiswaldense]CDK99630.1 protein of unknown function [Magnetospirillum gryphiswaldense MSR-1 v2]